MASKVYFADLRADVHENLQQKLTRLMKTAGMGDIDFQDKFVAIKLHFGEPGNLAFLRPNWARTVADFVKERGGKPFLTDCNTLYVGGRKNALDHMDSAMLNGFNPMTTGCQIIIADGLKGSDEVEVPVVGGEYVQNAKIGRAVMDADVFISLTHFKGHETAGFGGCLKNIGMGCGSRAGKMEQHNAGKPHVAEKYCIGCGQCRKICAHGAPIIENKKAHIDHDKCVGCGRCIAVCPRDAVQDRRVHQGGGGRPPLLPHLAGHRCIPQLRLPLGERHGHRAQRGHVRLLRPGGAGHGLRGRGERPDASAGLRRRRRPLRPRPLPAAPPGHQLAQLSGARREDRYRHAGV